MKKRQNQLNIKKHTDAFRKDVLKEMKKNNLSINQLSKETKLSRSTLSRFKRKRTIPTLRTYLLLANYFDLTY